MKFAAGWLASATPEVVEEFLTGLSGNALLALPWLFEFWALPHQLPPDGVWKTWIIMGGRGAGKTRAGAEWVRAQVEGAGPKDAGRARRVALVGETQDQVRDVMVMGESGILACSPPDRRPVWEAGRRRLVWPNGAEAQCYSAHDPESLRGPQFDAAWADEYGCPAVDRGTNQPNLFIDARSSESALPRGSTGRRDDLIQMQYLRAYAEHFADPANNPQSPLYGGPMVDMSRAHVWAWDARPFPQFPALREVWSDGDSYRRGHWLNGRASAVPLGAVVAEIAGRAGLSAIGTDRLYGAVQGYEVTRVATGRAAIQPLSLAYGFDAAERGGRLEFASRTGVAKAELDPLALVQGGDGDFSVQRANAVENGDEVRITHVEAAGDYQARVTSARSGGGAGVTEAELALLLTDAEARGIAERWMAEADIARDVARFVLPPSRMDLGSGDVVRIKGQSFRIDSVEIAEALTVEAVRTEAGVYALPERAERPEGLVMAPTAGPVDVRFLDLPLLTGVENPVAPHVAVAADPWKGSVAVWSSDGGDGYRLAARAEVASVLGVTENPLAAARPGLWDRAGVLRVRLSQAGLSSAAMSSVLNGRNLVAVGTVGADDWEVLQFAEAVPVAGTTWELRGLLRGQCGTDGIMPEVWPAGSAFVLLDGTQPQLRLSAGEAGLSRRYRIGFAALGPDGPDVVVREGAFAGIGQRPYPVAHLRLNEEAAGTRITWIRRTRIGGDSWQGLEVPLGETREAYVLRIRQGAQVLREIEVSSPTFLYTAAMKAVDQAGAQWRVEVAQLSDAFGAGPFRSLVAG